jgi:hypothetical protein
MREAAGVVFPTKHGALSGALPKYKEAAIFLEKPEPKLELNKEELYQRRP